MSRIPGWAEATGNRKPHQDLIDPILKALAELGRAVGPRRVTYRLLDHHRETVIVARFIKEGKDRHDDPKVVLDEKVKDTIAVMREVGLIHPWLILDGRSSEEIPITTDGADGYLSQFIGDTERRFRFDRQRGQLQRIEIWTEAADTIPDLRRLCDEYGIPVVSSSGSLTVGVRSNLGRRLLLNTVNDPDVVTIVLYLGDFDPPGLAIPDRLMDARRWAVRWAVYGELIADKVPQRAAWKIAATADVEGARAPELRVERLAVVRRDLAGRTTSPVKRDLIVKTAKAGSGAYARWWPKGETRTLQLEAIDVPDVVARVRRRVVKLTNDAVLDDVLTQEYEGRAEALRRLRGEDDTDFEDDDDEDDTDPV